MQNRTNIFDWLRLSGAFAVIVGHSYVLLGQSAPAVGRYEVHTVGVIIFFLVSGYLITGSWMSDRNYLRFGIKRASRIMPALIVVVLLTALVLGPLVTVDPNYFRNPEVFKYIWRNILLLPYHSLPGVFSGNPESAVNGSLWTLPVEVLMYAITPLLVFSGRWLCLLGAGVLLAYPFTGEVAGFGLSGASSVIPYFLVGSALKMWGFVVPNLGFPQIPSDISYGVYLTAFPVQQTIIQYVPGITVWTLILWTSLVSVGLGLLSWNLIERPALAVGHRLARWSADNGRLKASESTR